MKINSDRVGDTIVPQGADEAHCRGSRSNQPLAVVHQF
jgi:hypothetical protein